MKNVLTLLTILFCGSLVAINPISNPALLDEFKSSSDAIDFELAQLQDINDIVIDNNYDFNALSATHADAIATTNLSNKAAAGIFDGHPDNPLGIPGFWWGFCLGWVGALIIYLTMDEGSDRKEQVKNAIYGCIASVLIWGLVWFGLIAAAAST